MGRNCRFLQSPPQMQQLSGHKSTESPEPVTKMRRAIRANKEIRVEIINYKKSGVPFNNVVTVLPLYPDSSGHHYAVGLQAEV